LNQIIEETLLLYKQAHKDILFSFHKYEEIPLVNLDREQIKRTFINLLDNAVDAVDQQNGEVVLSSYYDGVLNVVRVEVADNGIGISLENKLRLFEPYFSTKKSGTGLGLAIVSTIIADHNGYIRVQDNKPRGTRFIIELPVRI
jgi:two-component system nitrogen regulation sensor histidine kinase NtrY